MNTEVIFLSLAALGVIISFIGVLLSFRRLMQKDKVLVVDDDANLREHLSEELRDNRFQVYPASTVKEAEQLIEQEHFRYVVIDLKMRTQNSEWGGIEVFKFFKEKQPDAEPVILSGHSLSEIAEAGFPQEAQDMQKVFISKGDPNRNYILAVLEMLKV